MEGESRLINLGEGVVKRKPPIGGGARIPEIKKIERRAESVEEIKKIEPRKQGELSGEYIIGVTEEGKIIAQKNTSDQKDETFFSPYAEGAEGQEETKTMYKLLQIK
jgi:hypothetical protein